MTTVARDALVIDGIACRWQAQVPDTLPLAREWVGGITGNIAAQQLRRDPRGRPRLPEGMGDISWSHAGGRLLLAHAASGIVGVDVERLARRVDALRVARRHFADAETGMLEALDPTLRGAAFLCLWCAKEAVLKAHGHGIAFGLSRVAFTMEGDQPRMTRCDPALGAPADWRLHAFAPEPGYLAVLARRDGILRG